jgi:hypothetical protein
LDCIGHVEQPASIVLPTGLDTTQVILIVAGCLAFLVLMCVLKICCCEVQKKGKELPVYPEEKIRDEKSQNDGGIISDDDKESSKQYKLSKKVLVEPNLLRSEEESARYMSEQN